MEYCKCWKQWSLAYAWEGFCEEAAEFIEDPSWDEAQDLVWSLARFTPFPWVWNAARWLTPQKRAKHDARMREYGCMRSRRHLHNGRCPSE